MFYYFDPFLNLPFGSKFLDQPNNQSEPEEDYYGINQVIADAYSGGNLEVFPTMKKLGTIPVLEIPAYIRRGLSIPNNVEKVVVYYNPKNQKICIIPVDYSNEK